MNGSSWTRYLVAAALVLLVGAVWVLAEEIEMKVEVRNEGGQEITVDVNGVKETIHLDDLAEGEERVFEVGDHPITVKRVGDQLTLVHDQFMTGDLHHAGEGHSLFLVGEGEDSEHPCKRVMIMKKGDGEAIDISVLEGGESDVVFFGDGDHSDHHANKWIAEDGEGGPIIIKRMGPHGGGDFVHYRCEETGSMLTVKADENLLDDYIDPVTGCVMKKVENAGVHVIKIREEFITEDEKE
ncbi:MAG: hypothetical protein IFJ96_04940 [Acidobacteria bacterium]|nr:hypothetical protein [Candidatus Sulfomarinibacter sp. MAG AM2]